MTKSYRKRYWLLVILSFLCNIGALSFYSIKALVEANLTHEKVALCMTVFIVLIMTVISLANKIVLRSRLWILLIGLYLCLDYILTPLIIIACCQVVDELILSPLKYSMKNKLIIHKQIDRRT